MNEPYGSPPKQLLHFMYNNEICFTQLSTSFIQLSIGFTLLSCTFTFGNKTNKIDGSSP